MSGKRCGKTIYILQEYENAKADGKKVLLVDKEHLEKGLLGAETPFDKLYKKLKGGEWGMTKRFTFGAVSPNVAMIKDNGQGLDIGEIVDLLNSLSEENEQLRQELAELLAVHTKIVETLDNEFVSKALEDGEGV